MVSFKKQGMYRKEPYPHSTKKNSIRQQLIGKDKVISRIEKMALYIFQSSVKVKDLLTADYISPFMGVASSQMSLQKHPIMTLQ
jgi:hypothetical protein